MVDLCSVCRRSFDSPTAVLTHQAQEHSIGSTNESRGVPGGSGRPGLQCAECGESFALDVELALHAARPHSNLRRL